MDGDDVVRPIRRRLRRRRPRQGRLLRRRGRVVVVDAVLTRGVRSLPEIHHSWVLECCRHGIGIGTGTGEIICVKKKMMEMKGESERDRMLTVGIYL